MSAFLKIVGPQLFVCENLGDPQAPEDHLAIEITPELHRQLLIHWHAAQKGKVPAEAGKPAAGSLEGFDAFWAAYPKRVVKSEAKRIWMQRNLSKHAALIVAHVSRMADSADWQKDGGKFVPMPTTYLNQRRWEDDDVPAGQPENWL